MTGSVLQRFFPPPQFLRMPIAGVDISDASVHVADLGFDKNGRVVNRLERRDLPDGVIEDGRIKDVEKVKTFFTTLRKELGLHYVNVSLPEQHGYVVVVRIPKMLPDEIHGNLEFSLEEHVPLKASEAVFAYDIIRGGQPDDDLAFIELNVTAYPRNIVEEYLSAFEGTGIVPLRFEVESHAFARAVVPKGDTGTYMVVDFGKTRTGLAIVSKGAVRFTSTVNLGGDTITRAIARALDVTFEEAEQKKKEGGFQVDGGDESLLLALMPTASAIKDEIGKHYRYWNTHSAQFGKDKSKIDSILLCGGLANLVGLPEYLASNLRVDVRHANVFVNMNSFDNYIPHVPFSESLQYAATIGLALSSDR